jgi:hypothetical protein
LLDIFRTHFSLKDYEFTIDQFNYINNYLEATELLLQCLEKKDVSDKEAIMDRLLRVPQ